MVANVPTIYPGSRAAESVRLSIPQNIPNAPFACAIAALFQWLRHSSLKHTLLSHLPPQPDAWQAQFRALLTESVLDGDVSAEFRRIGEAICRYNHSSTQGYHDPSDFLLDYLQHVYDDSYSDLAASLHTKVFFSYQCATCDNVEEAGDVDSLLFAIAIMPEKFSDSAPLPIEHILPRPNGRHTCRKCVDVAMDGQDAQLVLPSSPLKLSPDQKCLLLQFQHVDDRNKLSPRNIALPPHIIAPAKGGRDLHLALEAIIQYMVLPSGADEQRGHYRALVRRDRSEWWVVDDGHNRLADDQLEPWLDSSLTWFTVNAMYERLSEDEFDECVGQLYFQPLP